MTDSASSSDTAASRRDTLLALIAANLVPLVGVLFWGWSVSSVLILYWFENVVIGILNIAKMLLSAAPDELAATKLFYVPFFMVHYFAFCGAHGIFLFALFGDTDGYFRASTGLNIVSALERAIDIFWTPLAAAAAALALSHLYSFVRNIVIGGEYLKIGPRRLMSAPYGRVVVLHLTIIGGGFAATMLASPVWMILILVLVKIAVDLKMHLLEHRRIAEIE